MRFALPRKTGSRTLIAAIRQYRFIQAPQRLLAAE